MWGDALDYWTYEVLWRSYHRLSLPGRDHHDCGGVDASVLRSARTTQDRRIGWLDRLLSASLVRSGFDSLVSHVAYSAGRTATRLQASEDERRSLRLVGGDRSGGAGG